MAANAKAEWVRGVLGVQLAAAAAPPGSAGTVDEAAFRRGFGNALTAWREASDAVDAQFNSLRKALLASDDEDLHRIAEFGLNGVTGSRKVGLHKALREVAAASGPALPPLAQKAVQAATEYRSFVQSDERVKACDAYPSIVTPIGTTLGRALSALAQALTL